MARRADRIGLAVYAANGAVLSGAAPWIDQILVQHLGLAESGPAPG